jgi:hypothetical protein
MASMGPSFPPHPAAGMPQHPGAPTHQMGAPGMAHNPSQPGAPPQGIPHQLAPHMAVSAPGGQMNPGSLVGGMPPGAGGPSAHAMSHLTPSQAQIFQAQHGNMGACELRPVTCSFSYLQHANTLLVTANNQAMQQMQQQQRLHQLQQQQHARQLMQYQQQGGMTGIPMGMNMNLLSPAAQQQAAQLAAIRARQQQNPQAQVSRHPGAGVWTVQTGFWCSEVDANVKIAGNDRAADCAPAAAARRGEPPDGATRR